VYFLLEKAGLDCTLYKASQVKALPGRPKTGKLDSAWLAVITERGSLQGSFVPPEDVRRLRTCTRYRRHLVQALTAEKQRAEKLQEDAHLKLSSVLADIHGASGRAMLEAIIAGQRDPAALAQLARGVTRRKLRQRAGPDRRDRRRHDPLPHPRPPGLLGQAGTRRQRVRRPAQGQGSRTRKPLLRRHPRRGRRQRRPHPDLPRRQVPPPHPPHAQAQGPARHHAHPARQPTAQTTVGCFRLPAKGEIFGTGTYAPTRERA